MLVWSIAFGALFAYWLTMEAAQPGQQYADPLLPCAYLAWWPTALALPFIWRTRG